MRPRRSPIANRQMDRCRVEPIRILQPDHAMIKLAAVLDWEQMSQTFGKTFHPEKGRPGHSIHLMAALHQYT